MLIFGVKRLLSLKNCQMRPQNGFLRFSPKIQLFSKKLSNKKIFSVKFLIKKAIFIFGVKWSLTGRPGDTVGRVANQVRAEGGSVPSILTSTFRNIPLPTHFLRQIFFTSSRNKEFDEDCFSYKCMVFNFEVIFEKFRKKQQKFLKKRAGNEILRNFRKIL